MRLSSSGLELRSELELIAAYSMLGHSFWRTFVTMPHEHRLLGASWTLLFASCAIGYFVTQYRSASVRDERKRLLAMIAITLLALIDNTWEFAINWCERT